MKLSNNQKKLQKQIHKLLLSGIPLVTLIPGDLEGYENKSAPTIRGEIPSVKQKLRIYIVKNGDTMCKIAKEHETTVKELCRINGIPEENAGKLKIGQKLQLPIKNAVKEKNIQMPVGTVAAPENSKNEKKSQKILLGIPVKKK